MRYIPKNINSPAAKLLDDWNRKRLKANQKLIYEDLDCKSELNEELITEQGKICCYCQQRITKIKIGRAGDAHNEHLLPQNGPSAVFEKQTYYGNIFACCCHSQGFPKNLQHCGEAKHDKIIYDFIKWVDCDSHFKYNSLGEITPAGEYDTFKEFEDNRKKLSEKQIHALDTIKILKLNQKVLMEERRKDLFALISILNGLTYDKVQEEIIYFNTPPYLRFVDMLLYYMRKKRP